MNILERIILQSKTVIASDIIGYV